MEDLIDKFHKHLDRCLQCKNNPFDLCGIGQVILSAAIVGGVSAQQSVQPTVLCAGHSDGSFVKDGVCQTCGLSSPHSG